MSTSPFVLPFQALRLSDVEVVGGKNAALGEMLSQLSSKGIRVPDGFATTAEAFRALLRENDLDAKVAARLEGLDVEDVNALSKAGAEIRSWVEHAKLPSRLETEVRAHYEALSKGRPLSVAVRSSATAEDLPDASFAGQQETFLNVVGIDAVLDRMRHVFASLYNDRAIAYRVHQGFAHSNVALSVGVQHMVRSDLGASGVLFTLDTESGFRDVVFITSSWGLGETVVQGAVNPDEFTVHKPTLRAGKRAIVRRSLGSKRVKMEFAEGAARVRTVDVPLADQRRFSLTDDEVLELSRFALTIEEHTGRPMDIEWGKDGVDGQLYILQARPETVKSRERADVVERFRVTGQGPVLVTGRAIGQKVGVGVVRVVPSVKDIDRVKPGDVLVTDMTDPNWEPVMKRASAIVTNRGGRTCHAAIIARELGIPAIVGCGEATTTLTDGAQVTVSCAEGDTGKVYAGTVPFEVEQSTRGALPPLATKLMLNVGTPDLAFEFAAIPNAGVGLARIEFVVNGIGVHPKAALHVDLLEPALKAQVLERSAGYESPKAFFREKLAEGVATIAAAFWPRPVIVRLSDFKSNEYRKLLGGERFEPIEENPMIGFRGASRYVAPDFADCFALECEALVKVRGELGLSNVELMVPFVRTLSEARRVTEALARHGLARGTDGLRLIMMCEVPSNAILANEFLEYFDGFSIGSNDLTQLTLGLDRDSGLVADAFDERDPAVKALLSQAIRACLAKGKYIGICGQGPSDHLDFAKWLVAEGIGSISLNPDTVVDTWKRLAAG
ncbi:MAG: phosphoenolpyruvate synthase [Myxococcaceae bacterium]|nr:phosphoenolpyruvate synthase [Myxococcaceae bacterium]